MGYRMVQAQLYHFFSISPIADEPTCILPVVTKDLPISPWFTPYEFL